MKDDNKVMEGDG